MSALRLIERPQGAAGAEQQFALVGQLLDVLAAELAALEAGDTSALTSVSTEKMRLLKALDPMVRARLDAPQRERLDALLEQAREANRRNGEYVAAQQAYMRARWSGLASIAGLPNFYSADGAANLPSKPRVSFGQA